LAGWVFGIDWVISNNRFIRKVSAKWEKTGSSGKSVRFVVWSSRHEVKLSEMEEDGSAVVFEEAEASGVGFDGLPTKGSVIHIDTFDGGRDGD